MELFLIKLTTKKERKEKKMEKHGKENDKKKRKIEKCNKQNHLTEGRHKLNSHSTSQSNTQLLYIVLVLIYVHANWYDSISAIIFLSPRCIFQYNVDSLIPLYNQKENKNVFPIRQSVFRISSIEKHAFIYPNIL